MQNPFQVTKNFTLTLQLAHPQVALHLHPMFFVVVFCVVSQPATTTQTTTAAVALKVRVGNFLRSAALRSRCQRRCRRRSRRIFTFISSSSTTRAAVDVVIVVAVSLLLLLLFSFLWRGRCKLDILNLICTFKTFAICSRAGGGTSRGGRCTPGRFGSCHQEALAGLTKET